MDEGWIRPGLILGAAAVLVVLNILEFKGKRRRDAAEIEALPKADSAELWFARKQYLQTQNIEQVLHILNTVMIATLIALLTA